MNELDFWCLLQTVALIGVRACKAAWMSVMSNHHSSIMHNRQCTRCVEFINIDVAVLLAGVYRQQRQVQRHRASVRLPQGEHQPADGQPLRHALQLPGPHTAAR